MNKSVCLGLIACFGITLPSCGHFPINGHSDANHLNPPDIEMSVGERRLAIQNDLSLWPMTSAVAGIESEDSEIVKVDPSSPHSRAYIQAMKPGITVLRYRPWNKAEQNRGFTVTVTENKRANNGR